VNFEIAMGLIAFVFGLIADVTRRSGLYEVSFWNLLFATAAIFVASMFRISRQLHQPGLATVMGLLNSRYTLQAEQQVKERSAASPGPPPHSGADSDDR
jgi:uncharacterized membrane protein